MKVRVLLRMSRNYQVSEVEAETTITNDSDIGEVMSELRANLVPQVNEGLNVIEGQLRAKTKEDEVAKKKDENAQMIEDMKNAK